MTYTLADAVHNDRISKWEFYEAITGHNWWTAEGLDFGEIHELRITPDDMIPVFDAVRNLERTYIHRRDPTAQYYMHAIGEVVLGYQSGDFETLKNAVENLLVSIVCD